MAKRDMRAVKHKKEPLENDDQGNITGGGGAEILPTPPVRPTSIPAHKKQKANQ